MVISMKLYLDSVLFIFKAKIFCNIISFGLAKHYNNFNFYRTKHLKPIFRKKIYDIVLLVYVCVII